MEDLRRVVDDDDDDNRGGCNCGRIRVDDESLDRSDRSSIMKSSLSDSVLKHSSSKESSATQ